MKYGMQIMEQCLEYGLTTNSIKFRQQLTSQSSDGDSNVCS